MSLRSFLDEKIKNEEKPKIIFTEVPIMKKTIEKERKSRKIQQNVNKDIQVILEKHRKIISKCEYCEKEIDHQNCKGEAVKYTHTDGETKTHYVNLECPNHIKEEDQEKCKETTISEYEWVFEELYPDEKPKDETPNINPPNNISLVKLLMEGFR